MTARFYILGNMNFPRVSFIPWFTLLLVLVYSPCHSLQELGRAETGSRSGNVLKNNVNNTSSDKLYVSCCSNNYFSSNNSTLATRSSRKFVFNEHEGNQKLARVSENHLLDTAERGQKWIRIRRDDQSAQKNNTRAGRKKSRINNGKQPVKKSDADSDSRPRRHRHADLSLWIDEQQVKLFSGLPFEISVITDGHVQPYILDPNFEKYLPVIPAEVGVVNFTWKAGDRKYFYHFDRLQSFSEDILLPPVVSVDTRGRIPRNPKVFSVFLPCSGQRSGVASFIVGLLIETRKGKPLAGTPLRLRLRKECSEKKPSEPDPECDSKCANGGWCNKDRVCHCPEGYMGPYCHTALCYPQCMNGGTCIAPGVCDCPKGFHGLHCEGGICGEKCLNGGKCIQKDTCDCTKGYYGHRCEYSKCMIPCLNGGKCRGVNLCRCPPNFSGNHCEIGVSSTLAPNRTTSSRHTCSLPCGHGDCVGPNRCQCHQGYFGRRCQRKV